MNRLAAPLLLVVSVLAPASAVAQDPLPGQPPQTTQKIDTESPAHIAVVDGAALLERDGRTETAPVSMPLLAGDRIRTQGGRVEILFDDGSTLHVDGQSVVDFQSDEVLRLLEGRVRLNITGVPGRDRVAYRIDAPAGWAQITSPGEYRLAIMRGTDSHDLELAVLRGAAELVNDDGRTLLAAGERAYARAGAAPSTAYVFNSAAWDGFDRWSEARRDDRLGARSEYLPESVQAYASTFERHGSWRYAEDHGYVWYPRVTAGWRPYYQGRWATLRPYGWTWIGSDPWAWPTHHYGRWGLSAGVWFWIPGRSWGPAWVSWAHASDYVSWCPLGWNNRPVIQIVNLRGGRYGYGYDRWNAWTVLPRRHFGYGYVNVHHVRGDRLDIRTRDGFIARDRGPDIRGYAVPRSASVIRRPGVASRGAVGIGGRDADLDAFRNRRSNRSPALGTGYPAPAREPRAVTQPPSGVRAYPSSRERTASPERAVLGRAVSPERAVAPERGASPERRAQPRSGAYPIDRGQPVSAAPERATSPDRTVAPERRAQPRTGAYPIDRGQPASAAPERAPIRRQPDGVSRGEGRTPDPVQRAEPQYRATPSPTAPSRVYRTPGRDAAPTAPSYRSRGVERSAPDRPTAAPSPRAAPPTRADAPVRPSAPSRSSAPPRSDAPARSSGPSRRSDDGGRATGGTARRRGGN